MEPSPEAVYRDPFDATHRPWPLPERPWSMLQTWHDLLFAHWPVDPAVARSTIPPQLDLDTYEGQAWVGVVPFRMTDIQLRPALVSFPWISAFPELNVRTYVTQRGDGKPGVYFYSLDASNLVAVATARLWYHLPYYAARIRCSRAGDGIDYTSRRVHPGAPPTNFTAQYAPTSSVFLSKPGSLEAWLTERYSLYTVRPNGRVSRGEIHHAPWPLHLAQAELRLDTLVAQHAIQLPDTAPLLHFARKLEVRLWTLQEVR